MYLFCTPLTSTSSPRFVVCMILEQFYVDGSIQYYYNYKHCKCSFYTINYKVITSVEVYVVEELHRK